MELTLGFIFQDDNILLGLKKRGFGQGKWNGYGGKIESGETIEQSLVREIKEEVSLVVKEYDKLGEIEFIFPQEEFLVHIFKITSYTGKPKESLEITWQWFKLSDIPYDKMWIDDKYWLPMLIQGKKFNGRFVFSDESGQSIKQYNLREI
ncbi:8-oxo-dGTP diphosphatase [Patescibacteria group bacterium]|nr:8-oxo-dGTP diphosphatase [Patescibacteria group bacterium]